MKTCLFSACYLEGEDASKSSRLERTQRYLDYYLALKGNLKFDSIVLVDNASQQESLIQLPGEIWSDQLELVHPGKPSIQIYRFPERLSGGGGYNYPYCWRALYFIQELILKRGYQKFIMIDTDSFILRQRLIDHVNASNQDWECFWCFKWDFPAAEFQILSEPAFHQYFDFIHQKTWLEQNGQCMERVLPFTKINKSFVVDRFGEDRIPQSPSMDFYSQAPLNIPLQFQGAG